MNIDDSMISSVRLGNERNGGLRLVYKVVARSKNAECGYQRTLRALVYHRVLRSVVISGLSGLSGHETEDMKRQDMKGYNVS